MAYTNLQEEYDALETRVKRALRLLIDASEEPSKHVDSNALRVNVFDYEELVIINDELTFLDGNGYHISLYSECDLADLIDIISKQ